MPAALTKIRTFKSFGYRDFRLLFAHSMGTSGGFFFQQVVIGWVTYDVTHSPLLTSIALGLDTLPNLLGAPLGGVIVDKLDRRKVLIFVPLYQCALSLAFGLLILLGVVQIWHIFTFVVLMGISWVLVEPARMAITPQIVGDANLVNGFSLIQLAFSVVRLLIPTLGGVVLAIYGPAATVFVQAGSQFMALCMAVLIQTRTISVDRLTIKSALIGLGSSIQLLSKTPVVRGLLLMTLLCPLVVVPFSSGLMPVFAAEVFQVGPARLGLLLSLSGAGSLVGTIVIASLGDFPRKGYAGMISLVVSAIGLLLLAFAPSFEVAAVAAIVIGAGFTGTQTINSSLLTRSVSPEYRGRVSGIWMATWGGVLAGGVVAGSVAGTFGAPAAAIVGACIVGAGVLGVGLTFKSVRVLD